MAIPSRQIGWGTEENLLYQISRQLEHLIAVSKKGGSTPTGISVYSQQLEFPISYASISLRCDGNNVQSYYTNQTANNMTELVNIFNSNDPSQFGVYSDGGNGTLKLTVTQATKTQYCPTGTLTTNVFSD
jgi:hypothetical protein